MGNFIKNKEVLIKTGLFYEYSGAIKIALKIYLLSLKNFYVKAKINIRLICCFFWLSEFKKFTLNFFKNNRTLDWLSIDWFFFYFKYSQYMGNHQFPLELLKKYKNILNYNSVTYKKFSNKFDLNMCFLNNYLRILSFNTSRISEMLKIARFFFKARKCYQEEKKEFLIMNRILEYFQNKFNFNSKVRNLFFSNNFEKKNKLPFLEEILKYSENLTEQEQNIIDQFKENITIDMKLYLARNKDNTELYSKSGENTLVTSKILKKFFNSSDSYCCFNRNLKRKINFILKFKKKLHNIRSQVSVMKLVNYYASLDSKNLNLYFFFNHIQKKLKIVRLPLNSFLFDTALKQKKKIITFNRSYILKLNIKAEELYEKKQINIMLKIFLILVLINLKLSLKFRKGDNQKKIIFNEISGKNIFNKKPLNLKKRVMCENIHMNGNLVLLAKILFHKIDKRKIGSNKYIIDKIIKILISNSVLIKTNTLNFRSMFTALASKKKKYIEAYNLLRLQCSTDPYSIQSWQLLSLIEKEIGNPVSKTLRFTLRVIRKNPDSIPGIIFAGNLCSAFGSSGYALAEFFQAYRWKSNSPLLNLSISIQYLNGSRNRRNDFKGLIIILCLSFFFRYKILRLFIVQVILQNNFYSDFLSQEILYNSGRILLFLDLNKKSKINFGSIFKFKKTLSKTRKFCRRSKNYIDLIVQKEALFNYLFLNECIEDREHLFY